MTREELHNIFDNLPEGKDHIAFDYPCCDCKERAYVIIFTSENGFQVSGGAVYTLQSGERKVKCLNCYEKNPAYEQKTEVYTRCVGYLRPISNMSESRQAEIRNRKMFKGLAS